MWHQPGALVVANGELNFIACHQDAACWLVYREVIIAGGSPSRRARVVAVDKLIMSLYNLPLYYLGEHIGLL